MRKLFSKAENMVVQYYAMAKHLTDLPPEMTQMEGYIADELVILKEKVRKKFSNMFQLVLPTFNEVSQENKKLMKRTGW